MKSKIFSSKYLKNMKGQLWIPVCIAIGFLMAFPVAALMDIGSWSASGDLLEASRSYEELWRRVFVILGVLITSGAAFINGVNGFWYLYSSSKVDFYHCLPVKRTQMFKQKVLTGLLYYLVPYVIMEFFTVCIGAANGFFSLELMGLALKMLLVHLLVYLVFYFSVVLAICLTGNLLMGALMLVGIFLYSPVLSILIQGCKTVFFSTAIAGNTILGTSKIFSPLVLCVDFVGDYVRGRYLGELWIVAIVGAVVCVTSFYAYVKRPMEAAGKSMVYKIVGKIVQFMIVIPAGIGVGLIFYTLPGNSTRIYWGIFGIIFGTVLVHGMLQVIYQLDFRGFVSHKVQLLIAGICVAACAVTLKMDLLGYDAYIPAYDKIEGIGFNWAQLSGSEMCEPVTAREDGTYDLGYNSYGISDAAGISSEIYQLMEEIVQKQESRELEGREWIDLNYVLKSGRKVSRTYRIETEDIRNLMKAFYETGTLKEMKYSFLQIDAKYLRSISGTFADGEEYALFQNEKKRYDELAEALAQDVKEADAETLLGEPCARLQFQYDNVPEENTDEVYVDNTYYASVYVYPEFKRTVAILEETGYPLSLEDVEITSANYNIYLEVKDAGLKMISDNIKIEEKERLEELKKCIRPYNFNTGWLESDRRIDLDIETANGRYSHTMSIRKGEMPEFLEEQIARAEKEDQESTQDVYASEGAQVDYN